MKEEKIKNNFPIRIYAHRGANRLFPENTAYAFEKAIEQGATHIETDVRCTKDKKIIVFHDSNTQRVLGGDKEISDLNLKELQKQNLSTRFMENNKGITSIPATYILTLEELLERFPKTHFNIDIKDKDARIVKQVIEILQTKNDYKRVLLTSFHSANFKNILKYRYKGEVGVSIKELILLRSLPSIFFKFVRIKGCALQIPRKYNIFRLDYSYLIHRCHAMGIRVDFWVVNDAKEADLLLKKGADGLMTDDISKIKDTVFEYSKTHNKSIDFTN